MKFIASFVLNCLMVCLAWPVVAQTATAQASTVVVPSEAPPKTMDLQTGFPDRNGPFSAMLVVIPVSELAQFDKPSDQVLHLSQVTSAQTGAELAIKLVFVGMGLDDKQTADVTYDLLILGPNKKVYGRSDFHTLTGYKGEVKVSNAVYDSGPEVVHLVFEDIDPLGTYTLYATISDNIARRSVPLKVTLTHIAKGETVAAKPKPKPKPKSKPKVKKRGKKRRY